MKKSIKLNNVLIYRKTNKNFWVNKITMSSYSILGIIFIQFKNDMCCVGVCEILIIVMKDYPLFLSKNIAHWKT